MQGALARGRWSAGLQKCYAYNCRGCPMSCCIALPASHTLLNAYNPAIMDSFIPAVHIKLTVPDCLW